MPHWKPGAASNEGPYEFPTCGLPVLTCAQYFFEILMSNKKIHLQIFNQGRRPHCWHFGFTLHLRESSTRNLWTFWTMLKKLQNWYFALWGRTHNRLKQISMNVISRWSWTKIVLLTATRALLPERRWCWATACGTILGRSVWRWRWWYIYYDEVSVCLFVCNEKWALPPGSLL